MASPVVTIVVVFIIIAVAAFLGVAYVTALTAYQIVGMLAIVLAMAAFAAFSLFKKKSRETSETIRNSRDALEWVKTQWKDWVNEEVTPVGTELVERWVGGEKFFVGKIARERKVPIGVVIGTRPPRFGYSNYVTEDTTVNEVWLRFSPNYPGAPNEFARPDESIFAMKHKPREVIKEKEVHTTDDTWGKEEGK